MQLQQILGAVSPAATLADISTCPDEIREVQAGQIPVLSPVCAAVFPNPPTGTSPWHFVNIPTTSPNPTQTVINTACGSNCVLVQIDHFMTVLKQSTNAPLARLQALSFVVHFVGDVHQPLHDADRNNDAGGNAEFVTLQGAVLRLHGIWDRQLVAAINPDPAALAQALSPEIASAQQESPASPTAWAVQAFHFALTTAYKGIPAAKGTKSVATISPAYQTAAETVIRTQLARAGVRLAAEIQSALP